MLRWLKSDVGPMRVIKRRAVLAVELSSICNLRCPMCSYPSIKRRKGLMEWQLFKKLIDDAANNGHSIASLHYFGEPLLWPHLVSGIKLMTSKGLHARISTNGMLLTSALAKELQDAGQREVMVTIDTLRKDVYGRIRCGGDFDTVKDNIHAALRAAPSMLISAQLMPTKFNLDESEAEFYREFGYADNFRVQKWFVVRMNDAEDVSCDIYHHPHEVDKRLCVKPYDRLDVLWDGTTVLCCLDAEGELRTGNINTNSIAYSWLGPQAMEIRRNIVLGKWSKYEVCKACSADHIVKEYGNRALMHYRAKLPIRFRRLERYLRRLHDHSVADGKCGLVMEK